MQIFKTLLSLVVAIAIVTSCTILKKSDPEREVRNFISSFQGSLATSDEQILKQFNGGQSPQTLLAVIKILQNKDQQFIVCSADFSNARITMDEKDIRVDIPVSFKFNDTESDASIATTLTLLLMVKNKNYVIGRMVGEEFYQAFTMLKNDNEWAIEQKLALQERLWIYEKARVLEQQFDTVIWYTTYNKMNYFYVVEGEWQNFFMDYNTWNRKNADAKMGLVNAQGEIIIPWSMISLAPFRSTSGL